MEQLKIKIEKPKRIRFLFKREFTHSIDRSLGFNFNKYRIINQYTVYHLDFNLWWINFKFSYRNIK